MSFVLAALLSAILVEIALRLPFAACLLRLTATARKTGRLLACGASDHWKERAMLGYAGIVFNASARLAGLLALLAAAAAALALGLEQSVPGFLGFLAAPAGLLTCLVSASLVLWARRGVLVLWARRGV